MVAAANIAVQSLCGVASLALVAVNLFQLALGVKLQRLQGNKERKLFDGATFGKLLQAPQRINRIFHRLSFCLALFIAGRCIDPVGALGVYPLWVQDLWSYNTASLLMAASSYYFGHVLTSSFTVNYKSMPHSLRKLLWMTTFVCNIVTVTLANFSWTIRLFGYESAFLTYGLFLLWVGIYTAVLVGLFDIGSFRLFQSMATVLKDKKRFARMMAPKASYTAILTPRTEQPQFNEKTGAPIGFAMSLLPDDRAAPSVRLMGLDSDAKPAASMAEYSKASSFAEDLPPVSRTFGTDDGKPVSRSFTEDSKPISGSLGDDSRPVSRMPTLESRAIYEHVAVMEEQEQDEGEGKPAASGSLASQDEVREKERLESLAALYAAAIPPAHGEPSTSHKSASVSSLSSKSLMAPPSRTARSSMIEAVSPGRRMLARATSNNKLAKSQSKLFTVLILINIIGVVVLCACIQLAVQTTTQTDVVDPNPNDFEVRFWLFYFVHMGVCATFCWYSWLPRSGQIAAFFLCNFQGLAEEENGLRSPPLQEIVVIKTQGRSNT